MSACGAPPTTPDATDDEDRPSFFTAAHWQEHAGAWVMRAFVLISYPVFALVLARGLGYAESLAALPLPFLDGRFLPKEDLVVLGFVGTLTLLALIARKRSAQLVLGVGVTVILWLGFPFSRLRWYRLLPDGPSLKQLTDVTAWAWLAAAGLLVVGAAFALVDNPRKTRAAYQAKRVPDGVRDAAARQLFTGAASAIAIGTAAAGTLALLYFLVEDGLARTAAALPRVNIVIALLAVGIAFALLVGLLIRGRDVATGATDARPPAAARETSGPPPGPYGAYLESQGAGLEPRRRP